MQRFANSIELKAPNLCVHRVPSLVVLLQGSTCVVVISWPFEFELGTGIVLFPPEAPTSVRIASLPSFEQLELENDQNSPSVPYVFQKLN